MLTPDAPEVNIVAPTSHEDGFTRNSTRLGLAGPSISPYRSRHAQAGPCACHERRAPGLGLAEVSFTPGQDRPRIEPVTIVTMVSVSMPSVTDDSPPAMAPGLS